MGRKLIMVMFVASMIVVRSSAARGCSLSLEPRKASFIAQVRIDGKGPFRFLLDTGTSITVISPELAVRVGATAGRRIEAISTTGAVSVTETTLRELRAGEITVNALPALIGPVAQWAAYGRIDGILGMNFLAGRSYLIDIRRNCLEPDVATTEVSGGSRFKARVIVGRVAVESPEYLLILDSAASLTVVTSKRAGALVQRTGLTEVGSAAGRQLAASGMVSRLRLGEIELRNLPALVMPKNDDSPEDALLPVNIFSTIYVDAARSMVVLNGTWVN